MHSFLWFSTHMNTTESGAGRALEAAREGAGATQSEVAGWLGISRATYQRRITGRADFTAYEVHVIRQRLALDLARQY